MKDGPILNFGEGPPTDDYFLHNPQSPRLKDPTVSAAAEGNSVRINVAGEPSSAIPISPWPMSPTRF